MDKHELEYRKYLLHYLKLNIEIAIDTELLSFKEFFETFEERYENEAE